VYNEATTHRRCTPVDAELERTAGKSWFDSELFQLLFDECYPDVFPSALEVRRVSASVPLGFVNGDYLSRQKYFYGGRNRAFWQRLGPEFSSGHLRRPGWWEHFDLFEWHRIASPERNKILAIATDSFLFSGEVYDELLALELCLEGSRSGCRVGDGWSDVLILGTAESRLWRTTCTDTRLSSVACKRERDRPLAGVVAHSEVMWRAHSQRLATTYGGHGTWRGTHGNGRDRERARRKANDRASVGHMGGRLWEEGLLLELRGQAGHTSSYRVLSELVVVERGGERGREEGRGYLAWRHLES